MGIEKLLDLLLEFLDLFRFWTVVDEYERAIVLQFGRFRRELQPGLRFIMPFAIDNVLTDNVEFRTQRLRTQTLTLKDKTQMVLTPVLGFKIKDIKKFLLRVEGAEDALKDIGSGAICTKVRHSDMDEMMSDEWHEELYQTIREEGYRFGILVQTVRLSDFAQLRTTRHIMSKDGDEVDLEDE